MAKKKKRSREATIDKCSQGNYIGAAEEMDIDTFLAGGFESFAQVDSDPRPRETMGAATTPAEAPVTQNVQRKALKSQHGRHSLKQATGPEPGNAPDEAGTSPVKEQLKSHKAQLEALKIADPAFYQYLVESDKALLDFSDEDDDPGSPTAAAFEDEHSHDPISVSDHETDNTPSGYADTATVERFCAGAREDASLRAVRNVLSLYRSACHYGDPTSNDDEAGSRLRIASDAAFQRILVFTLTEADTFFRRLLSLNPGAGTAVPAAAFKSSKCASKWRKVGPLVKSYLGNTQHLLAHLAEEHSSMFILRRLRASAGFLAPFELMRKKMLKLVAGMFGSSQSHRVRLQALLWMREVGITCGADALSAVLRASYRTFAAHANFVSSASLPHISFMVSGLVELYGIDLTISYEAMFGFVAQLAGLLRDALTMKTADAYREVYSWRAINCLELWGRVVAAHAERGGLGPLVYPVVQLLLAAARLVPSPRWFPVRLRLARILNAVAAATSVFVPVTPLLEVLSWPGFAKKVSGSGKCPDLLKQLRLSKANLKLASVQQELVEQTMELLSGSLALSARNPGFPELAHLPTVALRKFAKTTNAEKFRSQATLLLHAIDESAKFVGLRRDSVEFAPKDTAAAASFLQEVADSRIPLLAYAQRLAEKGAQKRLLAQNDSSQPVVDEAESGSDVELGDTAHLLPQGHSAEADLGGNTASTGKIVGQEGMVDASDIKEDDLIQDYIVSDDDDEHVATGSVPQLRQRQSKHSHRKSHKDRTTAVMTQKSKNKLQRVTGVKKKGNSKSARHEHGR